MVQTVESKVRISVGFTPKTETIIAAEAKRLGISFADQVRRITDQWASDRSAATRERIMVLDRETGSLRGVR